MAIGSSIFDFSTSCSALRSCVYVHAIALELLGVHLVSRQHEHSAFVQPWR